MNDTNDVAVETKTQKKKKSHAKKINDPIRKELDSIKRLLCVLLLKAGTSQAEIAFALGMDRADFSRLMPARKFKTFSEK